MVKNSVGIWAFGANATRFVPDGYHQELKKLSTEKKAELIAEKLGNLVDGLELHYPGEINCDNLDALIKALQKKMDIYAIPLGFHCMTEFIHGSFINPVPDLRKKAVKLAKKAVDMCEKVKAKLIIWPGGEGYNYPFQVNYVELWDRLIDGISEVVEYAAKKKVTVFLEHKHGEPAMKILMRNIGMTLFLIQKIKDKGIDTSLVRVNMDWQHLIMNGEHLPEYAALLLNEGKMGHHHANSGWGVFDDDNMPGSSNFMDILGLAKVLQEGNYGSNGERIGFDLFPYTEDVFEATRESILQWEFIYDLARKINTGDLKKAQGKKDAVGCYKVVYEALGLDNEFIKKIRK
jgi:xylose isomerase